MTPEPPDPVALAEADVRRLLPPDCGLQDPARLRTRLAALLETMHRQLLLAQSDARSAWASLDLERNLTRRNTHDLVSRCVELEEEQAALKLRVRELEGTP